MAILSAIASNSSPQISSEVLENRVRASSLKQRELGPVNYSLKLYRSSMHGGRDRLRKLKAGFSEIEPDLNEDPIDRWSSNIVSDEDFLYGEWDGHHTYHEGEEKGTFWGAIGDDIRAVEPPTGFQGLIAWLFLPAVAAAMYFNAPGEYIYIGAALFIIVFTIIEMDKPDKPHNFEPQIYNMERGARDKLINEYNTMNIWEFNEKYGDVWDFTLKKDDIMKR